MRKTTLFYTFIYLISICLCPVAEKADSLSRSMLAPRSELSTLARTHPLNKDLITELQSVLEDLKNHFKEVIDRVETEPGSEQLSLLQKKIKIDERIDVMEYGEILFANLKKISTADDKTKISAIKILNNFMKDWVRANYQYKPAQMFIANQIEKAKLHEKLPSIVYSIYHSNNPFLALFRNFLKFLYNHFSDSLPPSLHEISVAFTLMDYLKIYYQNPFPFVNALETESHGSEKYNYALLELLGSHRVDALPELMRLFAKFRDIEPQKRQDIEYLLTEIPQWEITASKGTENTLAIRRTSFPDRYNETQNPFLLELLALLSKEFKGELRIFSVADSDLRTAWEVQKVLSSISNEFSTQYQPSELNNRFYLIKDKRTGNYYTVDAYGNSIAAFNGNPLQSEKFEFSAFDASKDNPVHKSLIKAASLKGIGDYKSILSDPAFAFENVDMEIRAVSLTAPSVLENIQNGQMKPPMDFNFFDPPREEEKDKEHLILCRSILTYHPSMGYFTREQVEEAIKSLGSRLADGGYLFLGIGGFGKSESDMFDIYERKGNKLVALQWEDQRLQYLIRNHPMFKGALENSPELMSRLLRGYGYYSGLKPETTNTTLSKVGSFAETLSIKRYVGPEILLTAARPGIPKPLNKINNAA